MAAVGAVRRHARVRLPYSTPLDLRLRLFPGQVLLSCSWVWPVGPKDEGRRSPHGRGGPREKNPGFAFPGFHTGKGAPGAGQRCRGLAGVRLFGYRGRFRPARLDRPLTDPLT
jgi:hypothetical protein